MVFPIYEQGMRIQTPSNRLLRRPAIQQTQAIKAGSRLVDHDGDQEHDDDIADQTWSQSLQQATEDQNKAAGRQKRAVQAYTAVEDSHEKSSLHVPAHQIMRFPVVSIAATATLNQAWSLLQEERVHYLVLTDETRQPVGIISDRDLLQEAAGVGPLGQRGIDLSQAQLTDLVVDPLVTVSSETDIRDIARSMLRQNLRAVPVMGAQQTMVGIITRSDLLLGLANQALEVWT